EPAFAALDELVRHACSSLEAAAAAGGVSVSAELPANLPAVCMDTARIYEVLSNLIDNAIKYTPRGGKVLVKAGIPEDQRNFVRVSVCDTGRGIGPENVKRVFERFYQVPKELGSSRRGLGLGLFISRELVKAHGGAIGLESELGRGTTVSFTFPIFSLAPFIMPLLSPQNLEKGSIALLTIKLPPGEGPGDRAAPHHSRVVEILRRCIRSGNDILLPKFDERTPAGCFHALAFASPEEALAITHRIQEHLGRLLVPETVEVFSTAVALPPAKNKSLLQVAHRISRRIERLVEVESLQHQLPEPQGASSPANQACVRV
ncbi:MAG TPA: ATP-binding protein, partial [Terriglobia bacterium]|nr:ATP-binding protein [Terriglobia bacterium]